MSDIYEWPEKQKFATAFACKYLPKTGTARFYNSLVNPISNLIPIFGNFNVAIISWLVLGFIFYTVYELSPISSINSSDGQYVDLTTSILFSLLFYYILAFLFVFILYDKGCESLKDQARDYLYSVPKIIPRTLLSSAYPIDN